MSSKDDILVLVGMAEVRRRVEAYPDLLAACELLLSHYLRVVDPALDADYPVVLTQAKAAIAKARKES